VPTPHYALYSVKSLESITLLNSFDIGGVYFHGHATLEDLDGDHQAPLGFFVDQAAFHRFERAMSDADSLALAQERCGSAARPELTMARTTPISSSGMGVGCLPKLTIEATLLTSMIGERRQ